MSLAFDIVDLDFHHVIEEIDGDMWGIWQVTVQLEDGSTVDGTCHGDGISFAAETFEALEE